jgi:fructose-1,6-bisphosphatase/sedoheptulose 1,7-bisphosphatase-like protein
VRLEERINFLCNAPGPIAKMEKEKEKEKDKEKEKEKEKDVNEIPITLNENMTTEEMVKEEDLVFETDDDTLKDSEGIQI